MATYSSVLAWRIPGTEEPSGLPSMGLLRVETTEATQQQQQQQVFLERKVNRAQKTAYMAIFKTTFKKIVLNDNN